MNVVHLISSSGYYGAENVIVNLMEQLGRLNCETGLCVFENRKDPHTEVAARAKRLGLKATIIPCSGRFDHFMLRRLRSFLKGEAPSVIHTHGYKADIYGYIAGRGLGAAMVSTCHNWTRASISVRVYGALDRLILRYFGRVVAVTPQVAGQLREAGIAPQKITIIRNGVWIDPSACEAVVHDSVDRASQVKEALCPDDRAVREAESVSCGKRLVVAMVARVVREKGVYEFLHAAAEVLKFFPGTNFWIAGDGPDRVQLEKESRRLGVHDMFKVLGHVTDMREFYASADIVTLPSFAEGLPMSILEAMAAGKAVVASRVGGIPSVVTDGNTGLLIEAGNLAALAGSISRLIGDLRLRKELGANGREFVATHFSASAMAASYLSLYQEITKAPFGADQSHLLSNELS